MRVLFAGVVLLLSLSYGFLKHNEPLSGVGIYGGSNVTIEEVPFMAIVNNQFGFTCGGAIVGRQFVLTAAHCCKDSVNLTSVTVGTDHLIEGGYTVNVAEVHAHPDYDDHTTDSDICVLKLEIKLNISETVRPLPMADENFELNEGDVLETIGFGKTETGKPSEHLLKVSLQYVTNKKCNDIYQKTEYHQNITDTMLCAGGKKGKGSCHKPSEHLLKVSLQYVTNKKCNDIYQKTEYHQNITDTMLCAGGKKGKGSCHGDSGSAIFYNKQVVGLTSFGDGRCGDNGVPSVFARISALRSFVDGIIAQGV